MNPKPQTVSRRALSYAAASRRHHGHPRLERAWAAGYRAAMRDVRQAHNRDDVAVHELLNDTERMK